MVNEPCVRRYFGKCLPGLIEAIRQNSKNLLDHELVRALSEETLFQRFHLDRVFGYNFIQGLYFGGQQSYVPRDVVLAYRSMINLAPPDVSQVIRGFFEDCLAEMGWIEAVSQALFQSYRYSGSFQLIQVVDFSVGAGVYQFVFELDSGLKVPLFLKQDAPPGTNLAHEPFYFELQKQFLYPALSTPSPFYYQNENGPNVLVSFPFPGQAADQLLSKWFVRPDSFSGDYAHFMQHLLSHFVEHAALGDFVGRNDRHLSNVHLAWQNMHEESCPALSSWSSLMVLDFDISYLLSPQNEAWIYEDLVQGLSEMNLVRLCLPDFLEDEQGVLQGLWGQVKDIYHRTWEKLSSSEAQVWMIETLEKHSYGKSIQEEKDFIARSWQKNPEALLHKQWSLLLGPYRERCLYKKVLSELVGAGLGEPLLLERLGCYADVNPVRSIAHYLEAFRGVCSDGFAQNHGVKQRLAWSEVEWMIREDLGLEEKSAMDCSVARYYEQADQYALN